MTTSHPRSARTIAAVLPPAPEPTTIALRPTPAPPREPDAADRPLEVLRDELRRLRAHGVRPVRGADLCLRVAARLGVAGEGDVLPPHQPLVPAVLGHAVHPLDRMLEQQRREPRLRE